VFEALQAMVLIHLALHIEGHGMSVSVGLPDRVLEPFVEDMRDREETVALFGAFMLKLTANSVFGRGSKTQAITVGGADHTGQDRCNAWTRCFIEAADLVRVGDPHVFLRWHPVCDPGIKELAARLLADGLSMPLLINDETTVRGFINAGVDPVDAWGYCVIGCNELGIPGISAESANSRAGNVQYLALLNEVLFDHPDPDALSSIEEVLRLMERRLRERNRDARQRYVKAMERIAERAPVPFTSALMDGCVDAGADMTQAMKYRLPGLYERGLTNAANALAAIDQLAFRNRELPLSALVADLRRDFQASDLQARLRAVPKWGNDDDRVDRWTERLLAMRERVLDDIDREFGHGGHLVCHVVRSLHHFDGFRIGASPDGRNAGTPVADSLGAQTGTAHHGPTAILNSVAKIDAARYYRGGTNLNITLSKRDTRSDAVLSLIEGFFRRGGQELQINCLDAETLREAQCDPETYGDLVVRFAGLSSRFVDLSPVEQDELIARAE
jgi:formate C-acetyltransferase